MRRTSLLAATLAAILAAILASGMTSASLAQAASPGVTHAAKHMVVRRTGLAAGDPFCKQLSKNRYLASSGAYMYCLGAQHISQPLKVKQAVRPQIPGPVNVNAASLSEDINPAGVRAPGQSETSIAASGPYVVEAWNDATGFVAPCPSPMSKEEGTGFAFSANGGLSFTDLGGLPNGACDKNVYQGDPSVAAYVAGGHTYFYISSLYDPASGFGPSNVAMDACQVVGTGSSATLSCSQPTILGSSTQCQTVQSGKTTFEFCSFTDKDYIAIDPAHGRLYATFTDFLLTTAGTQVMMSACDLGNRAGGRGPAGGTPAAPVCEHGTPLVPKPHHFLIGKPYFSVANPDPRGCENEGAYPAVNPSTGSAYVAYEFNIGTNLFPPCSTAATPTADVMTKTPARCLPLAAVAACSGPPARIEAPVVSMVGVPIPGYNRFGSNDFPRLAVSGRYGVVSMVWNDTENNPLGNILLQSFNLNSLRPVQAEPVTLNTSSVGMHMFPAVRTANAAGLLDVMWYSRDSVPTTVTNVDGVLGLSPLATTSPSSNTRITDVPSDWNNTASVIAPNFGDYIDAALSTTGTAPYVGSTLYVAWSDGRLGVPQPFEANLPG